VRTVADSPLRVLLGDVVELDRALPGEDWLEARLERELPADWLEGLAAVDDAGAPVDRDQVAAEARATWVRSMRQHERRGTTGLESAFDDELNGRLGLRLVEQDSRRREHRQWGHLRGMAGNDVRTTLDLDLQRLAEAAVASAWQRMRNLHDDASDADKVEAALAVIDARTGDVLAYAGAPVVSPSPRDLPGVVWVLNGDLGSVVKPFVLVEQLQCEAAGRPHRALATLEDCNYRFRHEGHTWYCSHAHGAGGRDPVEALAESCNVFYYQCGIGLGDEGIARALRRFGLTKPAADGVDPFAACWQPTVSGLRAAHPRRDDEITALPQRAVGYGVEASPLHVARAYAGLATGSLPTLGLSVAPRPGVPLDDVGRELAIVQEGLRACVQRGTARKLPKLDELGVCGKTGTAEVGRRDNENNAWFAGWLPEAGGAGAQLCFCAVVYWVKDKTHGGDAAGQTVVDFLTALQADPVLQQRWLLPGGGR
ncbi:MAG: penicillin-binding transpeptidase domain-containing protein, partial [Planctomycetota bacterium]